MLDCEALKRRCILNLEHERKGSPIHFMYSACIYHSAFGSRCTILRC